MSTTSLPMPAPCDAPRDAWERQPRLEDLTRHDIYTLRRRFLERWWPDVRGLAVLEVGSGPAHDSISFAQRGARVTAFDCSTTGLELARKIYAEIGLDLDTRPGDARQLPFDDDSFDLAFNGGVLEHFPDDQLERVIDEMVRVVRPGGRVLAFCPNRLNVFYQANLRRAVSHSYDYERAFTAAEMRQRLLARGLRNVDVSGVHVHPAPNYLLPTWLPGYHRIEPTCRACFGPLERFTGADHLKSLIGQDFVVWARVPRRLGPKRTITGMPGGPLVVGLRRAA